MQTARCLRTITYLIARNFEHCLLVRIKSFVVVLVLLQLLLPKCVMHVAQEERKQKHDQHSRG